MNARLTFICILFAAVAVLSAYPQRIVSLAPAMTEIVCQLGAESRLVGKTVACDYPESIKSLPAVGAFGSPDTERILELKPDLVVSNDLINPNLVHSLRMHSIMTFNQQINSTEDYCDCVKRLGDILGLQSAAAEEIRRVDTTNPPLGKTALVVIWEKPLIIAGNNTFPTALLRKAGAETPDLKNNLGYFTPSEEWLRSQKLDALITFQKESILKDLPFHIVYFPETDLLQRPGPRWTDGVDLLRNLLAALNPPTRSDIPPNALTSLRLWRIAAAFVIGAILSLAGLIFQTIFRNPLATPYTLGISSGAATGAAVAFVFGSSAILPLLVPTAAFTGAILTLCAVLFACRHDRDNSDSLLLCGVIMGVILSSLLIYVISIADSDELAGVTWWTLGDLQCLPPYGIIALAALLVCGYAVTRWNANALNALLLGDDSAIALGINPGRLRMTLIITASLMTSLAVSLAGIIGFVGLIIPHIARRFFSANHARLILPTAIGGGFFLLACDQLARALNPIRQTPVGVVTAIIGGILFLGILARRKY